MLPVVVGIEETKKSMILYASLVVALTLMFSATRSVGWVYLGASFGLGILFIYYAWRLLVSPGVEGAKTLYRYSLLYLFLLFLAIMIDSSVAI